MPVEIEEMAPQEAHALLARIGYGHLGCARDGRPYVIPIHYAYDEPNIYIFTTEGMKTEYIDANPQVCLQVEEVKDAANWQSVIVIGKAERLTSSEETERAMQCITRTNPTLTPAISITWVDVWGRANNICLYRIEPRVVSGRQTKRAPAMGES
ncbi:MAG: pyridoxamine 5'-phosphate oxidase family protein [Pyrinomonas sp.]|uniref:pyridoxamine 5'-phosphate oxidase family protein n=1 Tax=Pyrinomonas sp. TaxID=2080306 RepID=UPI00332C15D5